MKHPLIRFPESAFTGKIPLNDFIYPGCLLNPSPSTEKSLFMGWVINHAKIFVYLEHYPIDIVRKKLYYMQKYNDIL
jgi:hypothetical protein